MNTFSYIVLATGILSIGLSMYLWHFFSNTKHHLGSALKWMYVCEVVVASAMIFTWLSIEFIDRDLAKVVRALAFATSLASSLHMAYQLTEV